MLRSASLCIEKHCILNHCNGFHKWVNLTATTRHEDCHHRNVAEDKECEPEYDLILDASPPPSPPGYSGIPTLSLTSVHCTCPASLAVLTMYNVQCTMYNVQCTMYNDIFFRFANDDDVTTANIKLRKRRPFSILAQQLPDCVCGR